MTTFKPRDYQTAIAVKMLDPYAAIFADPGLGKTAAALLCWLTLQNLGVGRRALIIAPLRVCQLTWPAEVAKWAQFSEIKIANFTTATTEKQKIELFDSGASVFLISPDSVIWLRSIFNGDRIKQLRANIDDRTAKNDSPNIVAANRRDEKTIGRIEQLNKVVDPKTFFDTLIVDESTKFANWAAKRFKALKWWLRCFRRRVIMTGTPAETCITQLYAQSYICDLGESLGKNVTAFRRRYCYQNHFKKWLPHEGAAARIEAKMAPYTLRLDRSDFFDIPPVTNNDVWIEFPPAIQKRYDTLERELFIELENGDALTPGSALTSYGVCRQFANGAVYVNEDRVVGETVKRVRVGVEQIHDLKTDVVADLVDELFGKPVIVAYQFGHDLDRLRKRFGASTPVINGDTKNAAPIVEAWNAGTVPVLLCQPAAMEHGLNMQYGGGSDVIWYGVPNRPESYTQTNGRLRDQLRRAHHIGIRNTIDEVVLTTIREKSQTQKDFLDALNTYRKAKQNGR